MRKAAVVVFPGSNCDRDVLDVLQRIYQCPTQAVWHEEALPKDIGLVVLPGGFSYGDYLRAGALARFSRVMSDLPAFIDKGGRVLGICNGFQILTEAGLLPGALSKNASASFQCEMTHVRVEGQGGPFTSKAKPGQVLRLPIAHSMGRYVADANTLKRLNDERRIILRYSDAQGNVSDTTNVNGALENIAGIVDENRRVMGLMPHPERACEAVLGSTDGRVIFDSLLEVM